MKAYNMKKSNNEIREAYNQWAEIYDSNKNKTRDLEAIAIREMLQDISFKTCLEIGCGTGKNTQWLVNRAREITAVDFSEEMLLKARNKVQSDKVTFHQADITHPWLFIPTYYELIAFSLVLEHIENLDFIFSQAAKYITTGGYCYIGELHPFKQYTGTRARFESDSGTQFLTCYIHHISDFVLPAMNYGFDIVTIREYFPEEDRGSIPQVLAILFRKESK